MIINTNIQQTEKNNLFCLSHTAKSYREYIDELYEAIPTLSRQGVLSGISVVSDAMKNDIINSNDNIIASGTTYYISNHGDDCNDGISPDTPWATPQKLAEIQETLQEGDAVLFERGSEWRIIDGAIITAKKGVSYGAYGVGRKPRFIGSHRNYANESYWSETEYENVYECSFEFVNAGIMVFDYTGEIGKIDEHISKKKLYGLGGFSSLEDLTEDCSYYSDIETKKLYLCSHKGNPGKRFNSIEIGGRGSAIYNRSAKLIENFEINFFGYGVVGGPSMNVKNCIFGYLGGCQLYEKKENPTVCGNAIEICGSCDGFYVENCWMYQICDTGITHQQWARPGSVDHKNIAFNGNVVEYCYWSIEFNNIESDNGGQRRTINCDHSYNILSKGGYGFGGPDFYREGQATLYNCFGIPMVENCKCEKNILNQCTGALYRVGSMGDAEIKYSRNINVQDENGKLGLILFREVYDYNAEGIHRLEELTQQENCVFITQV